MNHQKCGGDPCGEYEKFVPCMNNEPCEGDEYVFAEEEETGNRFHYLSADSQNVTDII